jgi:hypothetical protein
MAKQIELEPRWLVSLLSSWAKRSLSEQTRAVGWYSICPMLQSGIPGKARSYEPTGYSEGDHKATADAINLLDLEHRMAVARHFKPWAKAAIEAEFPLSNDTWMRRLRAALVILEGELRLTVAETPDCG